MIQNGTKTECNKRNRTCAANFVWSTYRLIMIDTLLLRTSLRFTPLHNTCRHFISSHLNFTQLHFTTLSFGLTPFQFPTAPFHLTSLHFTSLHFTPLFTRFSPHFYRFHFKTPIIIALLTLFLQTLGLKRKVPNASAGERKKYIYHAPTGIRAPSLQ